MHIDRTLPTILNLCFMQGFPPMNYTPRSFCAQLHVLPQQFHAISCLDGDYDLAHPVNEYVKR